MTRITIVAEQEGLSDTSYRAMGGHMQAVGPSAGAALDALTRQLEPSDTSTFVVVQRARPDPFFTASQQRRLSELLDIRRDADRGGRQLSQQELAELELLVAAELEGATRRSAAIAHEIGL